MTNAPVLYGKPLVFKEGSHRYYWDGKPIPSVTTILNRLAKPALIQWAADCAVEHIRAELMSENEYPDDAAVEKVLEAARKAHAKKRDDAADIGTRVHDYAEAVLYGRKPEKAPDEATARGMKAFEDWLKEHTVEPIALERRVMSKDHWYAGTTDFFGTVDGVLSTLDYKTGKAIYDEAWLQTTGYEIALSEELQLQTPLQRHIIRLDKNTGEFEHKMQMQSVPHIKGWIALVMFDAMARQFKKAA